MRQGKADLLELEICALVCNALVSDTELARGRLGSGQLHLGGLQRGRADQLEWR